VRIRLADPSLGGRRVAARFHDESAWQALDALCFALGASYTRGGADGREVTVRARR
jgi:hypothetical protein